VMITRLLLSLKKASASQEQEWSIGELSTHNIMKFAERRGGVSTRDEIRLDTFASAQEGTSQDAGRDGVEDVPRDSTPSLHRGLEDLAG